jgi:hypothetical protein
LYDCEAVIDHSAKPIEQPKMFSMNLKSRSNTSISVTTNDKHHDDLYSVSDDEKIMEAEEVAH